MEVAGSIPVGIEGDGDDGYHEQVGVLAPTDAGHNGRGGEDPAESRPVLDLAEAAAATRARVGGKAAVLAELAVAGLPVPPGVVVTAHALDTEGWETALVEAVSRL